MRRIHTSIRVFSDAMKKTKQLKSDLARYGVHCTGKDEPTTDNGIEIEPKDELPPDQRRANRAAILKHLKYLLLQSQSVSDCKLAELACINELIEAKTRQLEHDSKNMGKCCLFLMRKPWKFSDLLF